MDDCVGCAEKKTAKEPQTAVRFRAFLKGGEVVDGTSPADWRAITGYVLGVRLEFSDGTSRTISGWSWIYLMEDGEHWTLDDGPDSNSLLLKYPQPDYKPGITVVEPQIQELVKRLQEPIR